MSVKNKTVSRSNANDYAKSVWKAVRSEATVTGDEVLGQAH